MSTLAPRRETDTTSAALDSPYGSPLGWIIVTWLGALLGIAVVVAWVLASYFAIDVAASISFPGDDGWCLPSVQGLGTHCWGDYSAIQFDSLTDPPAGPEGVYAMASRLVRIPFWALDSIFGFQVGLAAFVIASVCAALVPAIWCVRRLPWRFKPLVMTTAFVATAPFLVIVDRGNLLAFAIPLVLLFLLGMTRNRPWMAAAAVIAATTIKPQFVVLALALATHRYWKPALVAIAGSALAFVLPFALLGSGAYAGVIDWARHSAGWSRSQALSLDWPANLSLAHLLERGGNLIADLPDAAYSAVALLVVATVVFTMLAFGRSVDPLLTAIAFIAITILATPISFAYYGALVLPILAVVFRTEPIRWIGAGWDRVLKAALATAIVLSLTPLVIPFASTVPSGLPAELTPSLTTMLASAAWAVFLIVLASAAISSSRARRPHVTTAVDDDTDLDLDADEITAYV